MAGGSIVAIAKGVTQMMMWMKVQVVAAVAAGLVVMGGLGMVVSRGVTASGEAAKVGSLGGQGAAVIPVVKNSPVVVDLSTPMAAFNSMVEGMQARDAEVFGKVVEADSPAAGDYITAPAEGAGGGEAADRGVS